MVVRDECGNILDGNGTSTTHLYEHHMHAVDRIRKATVSSIFKSFNLCHSRFIINRTILEIHVRDSTKQN